MRKADREGAPAQRRVTRAHTTLTADIPPNRPLPAQRANAGGAGGALGGPPPPPILADDSDDTMLVVAAAAGFFVCMLCAGVLPMWGVDSQLVMAGGMMTLLGIVSMALFCQCLMPRFVIAADGSVSPFAIFLFAGCIGTMLGGMFGGTLENIQWDKYPKGTWMNP